MTPYGQLAVRRTADVPVDSLVRLTRSCEQAITGMATCTRQDILLAAGYPGSEENSWCLLGPGDEVFAWASLTPRGDTLGGTLTALPGPHGESAARTLLCLLLDRADEIAVERGRPGAVTVGGVLYGDPVVPAILEEAGFVRTSTTGQYGVGLTDPQLPVMLPDGGTIRPAGPYDLGALHALHLASVTKGPRIEDTTAFRTRLRRLRENGGLTLLMELSGRPAGHVLAQAAEGEGRVLDVGVMPAFRGLGIGLALLTAALAELRARGAVRALTTLETGDTHAPEALIRILTVHSARAVTHFRQAGG